MEIIICILRYIIDMKYLLYLFYFFCFFPYIQLFPFNTDSQPNALLVAAILFCLHKGKGKMNKYLFFLLLAFMAALIILIINRPITSLGIRLVGGYISLFLIPYATYISLKITNGIPYKLFIFVVLIWLLVGVAQLFVDLNFFQFLLYREAHSDLIESGRGVNSLAPEPTFYGVICVLLAIINQLCFRKEKYYKWILFACITQIFVISRSSACIFMIILSLFTYIIYQVFCSSESRNRYILFFLGIICGTFLFFIIDFSSLESYRIARLLSLLQSNPSMFLVIDASVNERFNHTFFSLYGFLTDWGFPHGFDAFTQKVLDIRSSGTFSTLFIDYFDPRAYQRIMSGIGALFFELGVFAFLPLYVIVKIFYCLQPKNPGSMFCLFLYLSVMLNAVPFMTALAPFIIGIVIYLNDELTSRTIL